MSDLLSGLRNAEWLDGQNFPPTSWVVPGLVPEGFSLLVGGPKIGKSWLSLSIALAAASGGTVLGSLQVGHPRPVLLLALEDGDKRLQSRQRHLMGDKPKPRLLDYLTRIHPGAVVETIEEWLSTIPADADPLIIIDTLGKVMPPATMGESSYQRDYRVGGRLKRIADERPGTALLVLHHDRKAAAEDFVDSVSGTNGIAGAADTIMLIHRPRTEQEGWLKITGRDVVEAEYRVKCDQGRWALVGDGLVEAAANAAIIKDTENLSDKSTDILILADKHPDGIRAADVADALGMSADDAGRYLRRLAEAEKLQKQSRGLYTRVRSVRLSEVDDLATGHTDASDTPLGLAHLPGRCGWCEWHVPTQGHAFGCPEQAAS